jgi:RNA 3'-terminal phosphate cyclase (ATP)
MTINIDGSLGEGGGQILRTSLALSLVTGKKFKIYNIRAGRQKPGLMRQHLTAVEAAARVGNATVSGGQIGSSEVTFTPGLVVPGNYEFSISTAGSVTLVLQTILPALMIAKQESFLTFQGGTHNPFAPPWDFIAKVFLPLVNKMGPFITTELINPGFYPAGGGRFTVNIKPSPLSAINITERGKILIKQARALISKLSSGIAHRELSAIGESLKLEKGNLHVEEVLNSLGPGNAVIIELMSEYITEVFTGFGERGITAETVAKNVVNEVTEYLSTPAPVGFHLADQLMIPFAIAGGGCFLTSILTEHSKTNADVIKQFLEININIFKKEDRTNLVCFSM